MKPWPRRSSACFATCTITSWLPEFTVLAARDEFKEHADAEREHADMLAERIQQLGGKPDFNPRSLLERSASQYVEGEDLAGMIREDLVAERIVIEIYQEMIRYFGNNDPTTRTILEKLLTDEEEHASDLTDLLYIVNPETGETEAQDPGTEPLKIHGRQDGGKPGEEKSAKRTQQAGKEEDHSKERNRILNELRRMGEKKNKPAA